MYYLIDAVDNYFFRSSAPFDAGAEANIAEGFFPPFPSVYAGALKPYAEEDAVIHHKFKIAYNGIWIDNEFYVPLPKDLYFKEKINKQKMRYALMNIKKASLSSFPLPFQPYIEKYSKDGKSVGLPYISVQELERYLNHTSAEIDAIDLEEDYFTAESRIGIEKDRESGVSKEHMIYETTAIRALSSHKLRLAVEADGMKNGIDGVIKLGGEGKRASITLIDSSVECQVNAEVTSCFKLYLATPAIFGKGWLPSWIDDKTMIGYFSYKKKKIRVRLLSACTGKQIPCGGFGFDKTANSYRPKELKYAVPAGSVYYFEILNGKFDDASQLFHGKCISDYREVLGFDYQVFNKTRYCDRGFGYAMIGSVTKEQEEIFHAK